MPPHGVMYLRVHAAGAAIVQAKQTQLLCSKRVLLYETCKVLSAASPSDQSESIPPTFTPVFEYLLNSELFSSLSSVLLIDMT